MASVAEIKFIIRAESQVQLRTIILIVLYFYYIYENEVILNQ